MGTERDTQPRPRARNAHPATALVFDIEEFAVHDGPGVRTTVFLKGCPLACTWCHNPEGISFDPQTMLDAAQRCPSCGARISLSTRRCPACERPIASAELTTGHTVGAVWTAPDLAGELLRNRPYLEPNGGGVTFSGGEPLAHAAFLEEIIPALRPLTIAIETSGQVATPVFRRIIDQIDLVYMDVKHTDPAIHREYTGLSNSLILRNLAVLCAAETDFIVRIPLIPTVNDTEENMAATARLLAGASHLRRVELLPYNEMADSKYRRIGTRYRPRFDVTRRPRVHTKPFDYYGITCEVQ